jgi:nicotinamide-nucleotide amidase
VNDSTDDAPAPTAAPTAVLAEEVRAAALDHGLTVGVAESLTGGALSAALAQAGDASEWFAGGVVAYQDATKYRVLGLPEGPVITASAARAMATGCRRLLSVDVALGITGVGGPGPEEGEPQGSVFICVVGPFGEQVVAEQFPGKPDEVVERSIERALGLLAGAISRAATPPGR